MPGITFGLILGMFAHEWSWTTQSAVLGIALAVDLYFLHLKYGDDK